MCKENYMELPTGLLVQLQSQTPASSITNFPNPGTLTVKFLPLISSSAHVSAVKVMLKEACIKITICILYVLAYVCAYKLNNTNAKIRY